MTGYGLGPALRELAPEPPEELGRADTARRRAQAVRQRRLVATSAVAAFLAVLGVGVTVSRRPAQPASASASLYANWPRRGDAPPEVVAEAVAAYDASMARGPERAGMPRVLYAGTDGVVALHVTAEAGGERLVVLTRRPDGAFAVYADVPAPEPTARAVSVLLDRVAAPAPGCGDATPRPVRLLVLAGPGRHRAQVWVTPPSPCPTAPDAPGWQDVAMRDGVGLRAFELPDAATTRVLVDDRPTQPGGHTDHPRRVGYGGVEVEDGNGFRPLAWANRRDESRARTLAWTLGDLGLLADYDPQGCVPSWSASLPDGTAVTLCVARRTMQSYAFLVADGPGRDVRVYSETLVDPDRPPPAFAALVQGLRDPWLVVVAAPDTADADVAGVGIRGVPLTNGSGWTRYGDELPADAFVEVREGARWRRVTVAREPRVLPLR
ncbi:MAG TPA: hypothetical protein VNA20_05935 [Frankiaceae bacterium]|nr:hypothetical protein [Frankiaceae bacterium]